MRVLQWNCRSIFAASTDLNVLSYQLCPDIILLQETWLSPEKLFCLRDFRSFRLDRPSKGGGLLIMVSSKFCHRANISFQLMSPECEILAVEITLPGSRPFSLANVYFPSGVQDTRPLDLVLAKCGKEIVLAGDFNSHHISWGVRSDQCGKRLWDWATSNNFLCQNSGSVTFLRGQFRSVLDLTFSGPGLSISAWETVNVGTNSDHVPIKFEVIGSQSAVEARIHSFVDYHRFKKMFADHFQINN